MTQQALNSLELYRGNNPELIKKALRIQHSSVVEELKQHCKAKDLDDLAIKLSLGYKG